MSICPSCDGVIGRDCFNPSECAWIGEQQERNAQRERDEYVRSLEQRIKQLESKLEASNV